MDHSSKKDKHGFALPTVSISRRNPPRTSLWRHENININGIRKSIDRGRLLHERYIGINSSTFVWPGQSTLCYIYTKAAIFDNLTPSKLSLMRN